MGKNDRYKVLSNIFKILDGHTKLCVGLPEVIEINKIVPFKYILINCLDIEQLFPFIKTYYQVTEGLSNLKISIKYRYTV